MRSIDKTAILAKAYKKWEEGFAAGEHHPPYNSSSGKFYYDIIANLIWVQKGLCAYTEFMMQDFEKCRSEKWVNDSYGKFDFAGELDHYNPLLKETEGWLWDNFFLIDADVNSKKVKGAKEPKGILKPDKPGFDPAYYLEYDVANHLFIPNRERLPEEQIIILDDLNCLGLNWQPTVERRGKYLNEYISDVKYGVITFEEANKKLMQFFTAFDLCKNYMSE